MADITKRGDEDCERGERGHRGHRGHDGHDGATGPTGPSGPLNVVPLIAAARVNPSGTFAGPQFGFAGIAHVLGTGIYELTLASPLPVDTDNLAIEITQTANGIPGVGGEETAAFVSPGVIAAITFNSAGAPLDRGFMVLVYDLNL